MKRYPTKINKAIEYDKKQQKIDKFVYHVPNIDPKDVKTPSSATDDRQFKQFLEYIKIDTTDDMGERIIRTRRPSELKNNLKEFTSFLFYGKDRTLKPFQVNMCEFIDEMMKQAYDNRINYPNTNGEYHRRFALYDVQTGEGKSISIFYLSVLSAYYPIFSKPIQQYPETMVTAMVVTPTTSLASQHYNEISRVYYRISYNRSQTGYSEYFPYIELNTTTELDEEGRQKVTKRADELVKICTGSGNFNLFNEVGDKRLQPYIIVCTYEHALQYLQRHMEIYDKNSKTPTTIRSILKCCIFDESHYITQGGRVAPRALNHWLRALNIPTLYMTGTVTDELKAILQEEAGPHPFYCKSISKRENPRIYKSILLKQPSYTKDKERLVIRQSAESIFTFMVRALQYESSNKKKRTIYFIENKKLIKLTAVKLYVLIKETNETNKEDEPFPIIKQIKEYRNYELCVEQLKKDIVIKTDTTDYKRILNNLGLAEITGDIPSMGDIIVDLFERGVVIVFSDIDIFTRKLLSFHLETVWSKWYVCISTSALAEGINPKFVRSVSINSKLSQKKECGISEIKCQQMLGRCDREDNGGISFYPKNCIKEAKIGDGPVETVITIGRNITLDMLYLINKFTNKQLTVIEEIPSVCEIGGFKNIEINIQLPSIKGYVNFPIIDSLSKISTSPAYEVNSQNEIQLRFSYKEKIYIFKSPFSSSFSSIFKNIIYLFLFTTQILLLNCH